VSRGKVLVTGGAGFIGCHTSVALLKAGYDVRVLDALLPPVHAEEVRPPWLPTDVELQVGDVRCKEQLGAAMTGVDAVIHLAAYQDYLPDFSTFFSVNTVGTAMLYEVAVERQLPIRKIVVASSQATYGEGAYKCRLHGTVMPPLRSDDQLRRGEWDLACAHCGETLQLQPTDESQVRPHNQYAISKYTQELVSLNLGERYGIPTTPLRYSIVQGPWQSFRNAYSGICRIFVLRVMAGKRPIGFEDGRQKRDYVWVGDVATANLLALEDPRTDFMSLNVGGAETLTVSEFSDSVSEVLERPDLKLDLPGLYRYGDTRHVVSNSEALVELGWLRTLRPREVIQRYAQWAASEPAATDTLDVALSRMLALGTVRAVQTSPRSAGGS